MTLSFEYIWKDSKFIERLQEGTDDTVDLEYVQQFRKIPILNKIYGYGSHNTINDLNVKELIQLTNELDFLDADNFLDATLLTLYKYDTISELPDSLIQRMEELFDDDKYDAELLRNIILYYLNMTHYNLNDNFYIEIVDQCIDPSISMNICYTTIHNFLNIKMIEKIELTLYPTLAIDISDSSDNKKTLKNKMFYYAKSLGIYSIKYECDNLSISFKMVHLLDILKKLFEMELNSSFNSGKIKYLPELQELINSSSSSFYDSYDSYDSYESTDEN